MEGEHGQLELGSQAFVGLLEAFRRGNIAERRCERQTLERHLGGLSGRWDEEFPGFPQERSAYASFGGMRRRGVRDAYLKQIIVRLLETQTLDLPDKTIINPACVIGRHARDLAVRLPNFKVIATDIFPASNRLYEYVRLKRTSENYEFRQDDLFESKVDAGAAAVVFFGACGSLSDAAMDWAIRADCPYLMCRTCCHDNIGGNTRITKRFTLLNLSFRFKNLGFSWAAEHLKGHYFSAKYSADQYPRSRAAAGLSHSKEFLEISRNSADSDICRALIDLDRYMHLAESGYNVWYKGELFVACREGAEERHEQAQE
ncbi:MAG: hypothetical protein JSW66_14290 [Phycisphaerales bacterium]|nr:MAG: hypothetical protein JSW66_14290 [Phycisphaerales bacterium]